MDKKNINHFQGSNIDRSIDFAITYDEIHDEYIADIFKFDIDRAQDAYVETFTFRTLAEAIEDLTLYKLRIR